MWESMNVGSPTGFSKGRLEACHRKQSIETEETENFVLRKARAVSVV